MGEFQRVGVGLCQVYSIWFQIVIRSRVKDVFLPYVSVG